jgi:hypothetical protein
LHKNSMAKLIWPIASPQLWKSCDILSSHDRGCGASVPRFHFENSATIIGLSSGLSW